MLSIKTHCSITEKRTLAIQLPEQVEPGDHEVILIIDTKSPTVPFNPMQFAGKINWPVDGMEYQKTVRNEWP
jgi:hypothetical protein